MKKLELAVGKEFEGFIVTKINNGYEDSLYIFMVDFKNIDTGKIYTICVNNYDDSEKYYHCEIFKGGEFKILKESASLYRLALNLKVQLLNI